MQQALTKKLKQLLSDSELNVTEEQLQKLVKLVELLDKWNKAFNLTSVRDPKEMLVKHIMDSLAVMPYLDKENYADVGTGPGLPGLPLAIVFPQKRFTLVDSLGKRIRFIVQTCHQLGIKNVTPVEGRVEQVNVDKPFDGVLSRAFASVTDMLQWCDHLTDHQGKFLALKGIYPQEELEQLSQNYKVLASHQLHVPELEGERHLIEIVKNS